MSLKSRALPLAVATFSVIATFAQGATISLERLNVCGNFVPTEEVCNESYAEHVDDNGQGWAESNLTLEYAYYEEYLAAVEEFGEGYVDDYDYWMDLRYYAEAYYQSSSNVSEIDFSVFGGVENGHIEPETSHARIEAIWNVHLDRPHRYRLSHAIGDDGLDWDRYPTVIESSVFGPRFVLDPPNEATSTVTRSRVLGPGLYQFGVSAEAFGYGWYTQNLSLQFTPVPVPLPAGLPLLVGALGLLARLHHRGRA